MQEQTTRTVCSRSYKLAGLIIIAVLAACFALPCAHAHAVSKPAKAAIAKAVSPDVSELSVKAKKTKHASGYQFKVSTSKSFKKDVETKTSEKRAVKFTSLEAGTKYYVKMRAYTQYKGKKVYGAWSAIKAVTVKDSDPGAGGTGQGAGKDTEKKQVATVNVQSYGSFDIELRPQVAPTTVQNFVSLANSGFYDGLTFHRMVSDFVLQGGDPLGMGQGGSDSTIVGEFQANGYENPLASSFGRGVVAMARKSSDYNSATSQFFITLASSQNVSDSLNGQYAAFGYVSAADMLVVDNIVNACVGHTGSDGTISDASAQPVIESIRIKEVAA